LLKHAIKISNHTLLVIFELTLALSLLMAIAGGAFLWRLSQGPVSLSFAREYVEHALSSDVDELYVQFDDVVLSWPGLRGPFLLDLSGLRVQQGKNDANAISIDNASIGLSRGALLLGRIRPVSVIVRSPSVELVREADGRFNLLLQDQAILDKDKAEQTQDVVPPGAQVATLFKGIADRKRGAQSTVFSRLESFVIENASVAIRDHANGLSWYLTDLDFFLQDYPQGIAASVEVALPGGRGQTSDVSVLLAYRRDVNDFRAQATLKNMNPAFISRFLSVPELVGGQDLFFSSEIEATLDDQLTLQSLSMTGDVDDGVISLPSEFDEPVSITDVGFEMRYAAGNKTLALPRLSGTIGGVSFTGEGEAILTKDSMSVPFTIKSDEVTREQIIKLFPKSEHDGEAWRWLSQNMDGGIFRNVQLKAELTGIRQVAQLPEAPAAWSLDVPDLKLEFAFENLTVDYSDTLMPVTDSAGTGALDLGAQTLSIKGERGKIGEASLSDISVLVTELMTVGAGTATIKGRVNGPLSSALSYISAEPIAMTQDQTGIDPKTAQGMMDAQVEVSLPTLKEVPAEAVNVSIDGTVTNVLLPAMINGMAVGGGPLRFKTEEGGFRITGKATLADREATVDYHQYYDSAGKPYSMQVKAQIGADRELRQRFGIELEEYISGTMPIDLTYTLKGTTATVDVAGDINPVRIYLEPFKFEKPVGMPGRITLTATLQNDVIKEVKNIELKSRDFTLSGGAISFIKQNGKEADIDFGKIQKATLGKTTMTVDFDVTPENVLIVRAEGPVFDALPFLDEGEKSDLGIEADGAVQEKVQPMRISLTADQMLTKNQQSVRGARLYSETDEDGDVTRLEYDAAVGKGSMFVRFRPDSTGKRTFRLETNDAGAALYAFGLYENVFGGTLLIYGEPKGGDLRGDLFGIMRMEGIRVRKAPALASLLSLMSLTGVQDLLSNQGLVFSKLESNFEWRFRPDGNLLIIKDGRTSGSSIGLTFEGVVNRGTQTTDVSGTIIPMTEINSILSAIPLVGNILGGKTGLIAATYTMKGPSSKPVVTVNPLSVLAPGFLRTILFEGGYQSKIPAEK